MYRTSFVCLDCTCNLRVCMWTSWLKGLTIKEYLFLLLGVQESWWLPNLGNGYELTVDQEAIVVIQSAYHLKQGQKAVDDVIKVHIWVYPSIFVRLLQASCLIWYDVCRNTFAIQVLALVKFSREKLHSKDTEYQPKQERHQKHVADSRYSGKKRVDDNL